MEGAHSLDFIGVVWRLGVTLLLVALNGFFVAAEFALVKVRRVRIVKLADEGSFTARVAKNILDHLDQYLSACQLGITLASLVLGALGEPAVASLISGSLQALDIQVDPSSTLLRWSALVIAFTTITVLHMTVGEQAPKMWALRNAQAAAVAVALPLRVFTAIFWPFIAFINALSNSMLRVVGINPEHGHEVIPTRSELRHALSLSAQAGHISEQGRELAQNVLRVVDMQVRHILVPRAEVVTLSLEHSAEENLRTMRESGHSRFALCETDLDTVVGFVHSKNVFERGPAAQTNDELRKMARPPVTVTDAHPLGSFLSQLQRAGSHVAVVMGEHGSALGLAFLEDAIEEIVGPIADEFDRDPATWVELDSGDIEISGTVPLPDVADRLEIPIATPLGSSIGGHVIGLLGRLPRKGETLPMGDFQVTVQTLGRGRTVGRLLFKRNRPAGAP